MGVSDEESWKKLELRARNGMYTYYILRRSHDAEVVEQEGELDEELFPGVDLDNGPTLIPHLVQKVNQEIGTNEIWEECDLTDSFFDREDAYVNFNGRWMRRSDRPWRKDRSN